MELTPYRRGQLERLAISYGIANAGSYTKDELVELLTPMVTEADLTGVAVEPAPERGITSVHAVESPGEE